MNARQKFHAVMNLEEAAPIPRTEYGYWVGTIKRFIAEGMPVTEPLAEDISDSGTIMGYEKTDPLGSEIPDRNVTACFNLDSYISKFPMDVSPMLDEIIDSEIG